MDLPKDLKGWRNQARERKEKDIEQEKLDLCEDGLSESVDVNGDGIVDDGDVHYSPDRKQDSSSEKKDESIQNKETKSLGFRR